MARSRRYVMTAKRRAALRKAQLASAKKRRKQRVKKAAKIGGAVVGVGVLGATLGVTYRVQGSPKVSVRKTTGIGLTGRPTKGKPFGFMNSSETVEKGIVVKTRNIGTASVARKRFIISIRRNLIGKKPLTKVPKIRDFDYSPNMSNSINYQISQSKAEIASLKGTTPPGGQAKSRKVKAVAFGNDSTRRRKNVIRTKVKHPLARNIMSELVTKQKRKVIFE